MAWLDLIHEVVVDRGSASRLNAKEFVACSVVALGYLGQNKVNGSGFCNSDALEVFVYYHHDGSECLYLAYRCRCITSRTNQSQLELNLTSVTASLHKL